MLLIIECIVFIWAESCTIHKHSVYTNIVYSIELSHSFDKQPQMMQQTDLQHESMWWVDKYRGVFPGWRLQTELSVRGLGVVCEGDGVGQFAVVQHLLVVLCQVDVTLRLKLEGALQRKNKIKNGTVTDGCEKNPFRRTLMRQDEGSVRPLWACVDKFSAQKWRLLNCSIEPCVNNTALA